MSTTCPMEQDSRLHIIFSNVLYGKYIIIVELYVIGCFQFPRLGWISKYATKCPLKGVDDDKNIAMTGVQNFTWLPYKWKWKFEYTNTLAHRFGWVIIAKYNPNKSDIETKLFFWEKIFASKHILLGSPHDHASRTSIVYYCFTLINNTFYISLLQNFKFCMHFMSSTLLFPMPIFSHLVMISKTNYQYGMQ